MSDFPSPTQLCPHCGATIDRAGALHSQDEVRGPRPGDYSVCIKCAGILVFDPTLRLRKPTAAEEREALAEPDMQIMLRAIRAVRAEHPEALHERRKPS